MRGNGWTARGPGVLILFLSSFPIPFDMRTMTSIKLISHFFLGVDMPDFLFILLVCFIGLSGWDGWDD